MPVFRNVNPNRQSGRVGKQTPVTYDGDGWPTAETNYFPNGGPLDGSISQSSTPSSSLSSFPAPRSYPHSRQQECGPYIPSDEQYQSPVIDTSCLPATRERHSRRREPGHIPRPRNAFIIFRSSYISNCASSGEGQQNELSKQAGKVWNMMTQDEKRSFVELAETEKKLHQAMYPNYIYCPGRGAARRKGKTITKNTKNTSGPKRMASTTPSSASFASSESTFPEVPLATPAQRPPRAAAQRAIERFHQSDSISPSPSPVPSILEHLELKYPDTFIEEGARAPKVNTRSSKPETLAKEDVLTVDVSVLEPTSIKGGEHEPHFDLAMRPPHFDRIPEQFGFKYHSDSAAMLAYLPPMPNTNIDTVCTGDVPSLFPWVSGLPVDPTAVCMTDDDLPVFSSDITEIWPQSTIPTFSDEAFKMLMSSPYHENSHYTSDIWSEEDVNFMGSFFNFEAAL